ncbi:MAG: hypothetical protein ACYS0F_17250 [Planctomycetota bacterium]|jgi:hypothetical protein
MDELNYRRLMKYPKRRCEESGATQYMDPQGIYRSIIDDHERFETCFDCGYLVGWCPAPDTCEQPIWVRERAAKKKGPAKKKAAKAPTAEKPAAGKPAAGKSTVTKKKTVRKPVARKRVTKKK